MFKGRGREGKCQFEREGKGRDIALAGVFCNLSLVCFFISSFSLSPLLLAVEALPIVVMELGPSHCG